MNERFRCLHIKVKNVLEKIIYDRYFPMYFMFLILGIISAFILINGYKQKSDQIQSGIADEVIRFHVLANSNSKEDQELKLVIKDYITKELEPNLKNISSVDDARDILSGYLVSIEELTNKKIRENGFSYTSKASLETDYFPLKVYGDISLPPGQYEAVRIELGNASGQNWWCIMFPPLCFVDSTYSVVPETSKDQLKDVLTEEEYDKIQVKPKFKVLTVLNDVFNLD